MPRRPSAVLRRQQEDDPLQAAHADVLDGGHHVGQHAVVVSRMCVGLDFALDGPRPADADLRLLPDAPTPFDLSQASKTVQGCSCRTSSSTPQTTRRPAASPSAVRAATRTPASSSRAVRTFSLMRFRAGATTDPGAPFRPAGCFCGTSLYTASGLGGLIDDSRCQETTCPGDTLAYCGGSKAMILYKQAGSGGASKRASRRAHVSHHRPSHGHH